MKNENKKQHFVPIFYLKYFSINGENKQIGILNKKSKKYIQAGKLKNQAYEDFFYGEDGNAEKALGKIEAQAATFLSQLIKEQCLPKKNYDSFKYIKEYTFLQESRTKSHVETYNEIVNQTTKNIMKHDDKVKHLTDELTFKWENAAVLSLNTLFKALHITKDLGCKLLINETSIPFITSDNPVVKYNQFLEKRNHPGGLTGLASKGLQVFFPINKKILLVYYDINVYGIGNRKQTKIIINNIDDVKSLNLLQYLNSDENIFFNESYHNSFAQDLIERAKLFHKKQKYKINESPKRKNKDGSFSTFLHGYKEEIKCKLNLSFIKELKKIKKYKLSGWAVELRKEEWRYNGFLKR